MLKKYVLLTLVCALFAQVEGAQHAQGRAGIVRTDGGTGGTPPLTPMLASAIGRGPIFPTSEVKWHKEPYLANVVGALVVILFCVIFLKSDVRADVELHDRTLAQMRELTSAGLVCPEGMLPLDGTVVPLCGMDAWLHQEAQAWAMSTEVVSLAGPHGCYPTNDTFVMARQFAKLVRNCHPGFLSHERLVTHLNSIACAGMEMLPVLYDFIQDELGKKGSLPERFIILLGYFIDNVGRANVLRTAESWDAFLAIVSDERVQAACPEAKEVAARMKLCSFIDRPQEPVSTRDFCAGKIT